MSHRTELPEPPTYTGEPMSVGALEAWIGEERDVQRRRVDDLQRFRERNDALQSALGAELTRLRELSDRPTQRGFLARLRRTLGLAPDDQRTSVEALLRSQYEASVLRLREAADFADRLGVAEADLFDEIDRLNGRIVASIDNRAKAARYVAELRDIVASLEGAAGSDADVARAQSLADRARRLLVEHGTRLELYRTADDRLSKLRGSARLLAETVGRLRSDLTRYVVVAGERLDMIGGQVQALGAAADASVVMLELEESLDALTESMNQAARFVSDTQSYFRDNVDTMIADMEVFDSETQAVLEANAEMARLDDEYVLREVDAQIDDATALAAFDERLAAEREAVEVVSLAEDR